MTQLYFGLWAVLLHGDHLRGFQFLNLKFTDSY